RFVATVAQQVEWAEANVMLHAGILQAYDAGSDRLEAVGGVERVAGGAAVEGRAQARLYRTTHKVLREHPEIAEEVFGPASLIVELDDADAMAEIAATLAGQLTATIHGNAGELAQYRDL